MLSTKSVLKRSRWSRSRASRKQSTSIVEYPVWKRGDSNYYRAAKLHCSAMLSQFHCTYTYTRRFWIILHAQWTRSECERRRPTGALSSNGGSQVRTFTPAISEDRHEGKNKLTWYACIHIPCVYTWKERERERETERQTGTAYLSNTQSITRARLFLLFLLMRERTICASRSVRILVHGLAEVTQNGEVNSTEESLDKLYRSSVPMREVRSDSKCIRYESIRTKLNYDCPTDTDLLRFDIWRHLATGCWTKDRSSGVGCKAARTSDIESWHLHTFARSLAWCHLM